MRFNSLNDRSSVRRGSDQGFFDRNLGVRLFLGLLAIFIVGSYMHFREPSREILELNKHAEKYVVAQVDFSFYDDELTNQLKQEAVRNIGQIYRMDEKEVREKAQTFDRSLVKDNKWRQEVGHNTFEEMNKAVLRLVAVLTRLRFSDVRTIKESGNLDIQAPSLKIFSPREPRKGNKIPLDIWQSVSKTAFAEDNLSPEATALILKFFRASDWKLEEDRKLRDHIRQEALKRVENVYTNVAAGERLVDQGEVVTNKHVTMLQAMKRVMQKSRNLWHPLTLLGSFTLASVFAFISILYLRAYHDEVISSNKKLLLLIVIMSINLCISKLIEYFMISTGGLFEFVRYPLYIPFCAILVCALINARLAIFASGANALIMSVTLSVDVDSFMLVNILSSIMAAFYCRSLSRRKDIFHVCVKCWLCVVFIILSITLFNNTPWTISILTDIVTTLAFMLFTAIVVAGLLPIFETTFNILTNITLMEYMDPNNDLLRRLTIEAPGTYQHSMVVGSLSEAAASSIGANGLLCRVSTLYHDIGKLTNPYYFSENQQGGVNMHQLLTPLESGQVIIGHVRDGVALARKEGLPEQFIDIIKEHHGTSLVQCMYHDQCKLMGGDKSLVDERDFRYSGPKPRTRESAIIMIADVLEAASRSIDEFNEETLVELVDKLVKDKSEDGQLDECSLTFEELGIVKKSLVKTLMMARHSRIKYPYQLQSEEGTA